ncbi:hypothetical protein OJE16_15820 [Pantoea tagorei]
MFPKLLRSVVLGLIVAGILLAALPALRMGGTSALLNHEDSEDETPFSFNAGVRRAVPAVVNVYNRSAHGNNNRGITTLGSGVIMNAKGYILTNKHVINNADQIIVALQDGRFF